MHYSNTRWLWLALSAAGIYYATNLSVAPELVSNCHARSLADESRSLRADAPLMLKLFDRDTSQATATFRLEAIPESTRPMNVEVAAPAFAERPASVRRHQSVDDAPSVAATMVRFGDIRESDAASKPVVSMARKVTIGRDQRESTPASHLRVPTDDPPIPLFYAPAIPDSADLESTADWGIPTLGLADGSDSADEVHRESERARLNDAGSNTTIISANRSVPRGPKVIKMPTAETGVLSITASSPVPLEIKMPRASTPKVDSPSRGIMHAFDAEIGSLELVPTQQPTVADLPTVAELPSANTETFAVDRIAVPSVDPVIMVEPKSVLVNKTDSSAELSDAKPKSSWSPVDLKTIELDTSVPGKQLPKVTEATPQDKTLARQALRLGFESAQKRMYFAARARFIETLQIIARSLDDQSLARHHADSLRRAMRAFDEAEDFFPKSTRPDQEINLGSIIKGHGTELLRTANADSLTPRQCVREYMAYAEQELALGLGQEELAAQALYGLGRLQAVSDPAILQSEQVQAHRSTMLYQTALRIDSNNFAAANELGVLLARFGRYPEAVSALEHSVRVSPQPTAWKNLAAVHERMGQLDAARLASRRATELAHVPDASPITVASRPQIEWVDARTFAGLQGDQAASDLQPRAPLAQPPRTAALPEKKKLSPWFWRN